MKNRGVQSRSPNNLNKSNVKTESPYVNRDANNGQGNHEKAKESPLNH